jgi:hypothetical protein
MRAVVIKKMDTRTKKESKTGRRWCDKIHKNKEEQ